MIRHIKGDPVVLIETVPDLPCHLVYVVFYLYLSRFPAKCRQGIAVSFVCMYDVAFSRHRLILVEKSVAHQVLAGSRAAGLVGSCSLEYAYLI